MRGGETVMAVPGGPHPAFTDRPQGIAMLQVQGREVARYVWGPNLPLATSPRPYLHPVRTLDGCPVTDAGPDSHPHQLGISIAAPNVGGRNFWGGRSFLPGHGPAWLDDHGVQQHQRWLRRTSTELAHTVRWIGAYEATLLTEQRSITCRPLDDTAWSLGIQTRLTNATEAPLLIQSPAAQGRAGAGYGGFFWRGPAIAGEVRVLSSIGADVRSVHGRIAGWVAVSGAGGGDRFWTVLFLPADETTAQDRWFVRARDYLGVGSSVAWDQPLVLAPGETITRHILTVIVDGVVSGEGAQALADAARSAI